LPTPVPNAHEASPTYAPTTAPTPLPTPVYTPASTPTVNHTGCSNFAGTYLDDDGNGGAAFDVYQSECRLTFTFDGADLSGIIEGSKLRVDGWSAGTLGPSPGGWAVNDTGVRFDDGGSWRKVCPAGQYGDYSSETCEVCATGRFAEGGAHTCTDCPSGKTSPVGASACEASLSYAPTTALIPLPTPGPSPASASAATPMPTPVPTPLPMPVPTPVPIVNHTGCSNATGTYLDDNGGNGGVAFDVTQSECHVVFTYEDGAHAGTVSGSTLQIEGWSEAIFNDTKVQFDDGGSWRKVLPNGIFQSAPPTMAPTPLPKPVPTPASTPTVNHTDCSNATGTYLDDNGGNDGTAFDVHQSECRLTLTYDGAHHSGIIEGSTLMVEGWSAGTFSNTGVRFDDGGSWLKVCPAGQYGDYTAHTVSETCEVCAAGRFAEGGAHTCTDCPIGKTSSVGASACEASPTYAPTTVPTPSHTPAPTPAHGTVPTHAPTSASCSYTLCGDEQVVSDLTSNSLCAKDGTTLTAPPGNTCLIDCTDVEGTSQGSGQAALKCGFRALFFSGSTVVSLGTCVC
jgi:hypothetical protein